MTVLGKLGDRPRVTIRRVVRVQYRLEWEYDGWEWDMGEADYDLCATRRARARFVSSAAVAYRMAAMRLIFAKRDKLASGKNEQGYPSGCRLCDEAPSRPEEQPQCRYHGGDDFETIRKRLARWLRWRDSIVPAPLCQPKESR